MPLFWYQAISMRPEIEAVYPPCYSLVFLLMCKLFGLSIFKKARLDSDNNSSNTSSSTSTVLAPPLCPQHDSEHCLQSGLYYSTAILMEISLKALHFRDFGFVSLSSFCNANKRCGGVTPANSQHPSSLSLTCTSCGRGRKQKAGEKIHGTR